MATTRASGSAARVRKPKSFAGELQKAETALASAADLASDPVVSKSLAVAALDVASQRIAAQKAALG